MPINQNHLFEELNGVKCAIVEKNVSKERAEFLKNILEFNQYTVIIVPAAPPKAAAAPAAKPAATPAEAGAAPAAGATPGTSTEGQQATEPAPPPPPPAPETFTIGVTDVMFNPTNAIFGRLLKAPNGHIVSLAYWQQKETQSNDELPYFDR